LVLFDEVETFGDSGDIYIFVLNNFFGLSQVMVDLGELLLVGLDGLLFFVEL
jgi:hypothetical protein